MKKLWGVLGVLLLTSMSMAIAAKPVKCPIKSTTDIVYYSGSGASSLSQSWMVHFLDWWQAQDSSIEYMDLSASQIGDCNLDSYPDLDLYIQPGGDAYLSQKWIGSTGKDKINSFLNNGGAYFGACAGWYYATSDYYWQGSYYDHSNLLGAYPSTVEGSIIEIADYDGSPSYDVTDLNNGLRALYWGGPTFGYQYTQSGAGTVETTFSYQNLPAVVKYNNMLLTSVHLEAYENDGFTGLSTEEREENYAYLATLINEVAGTNFNVPQPPEPPVCGDLVCEGDETYLTCPSDCEEPVPSSDVFIDDFEDGMDKWTISGTGNLWIQQSDFPYEGSYSARAKKTGVGNPTYMEAVIDGTGYSSLTFEYYRKLVGLDAADDFSAEYFDGSWNYVEHLGSGRENGQYVFKTFSIPAEATKIRFMCETGAVSEYCYVDNVRVIGQ